MERQKLLDAGIDYDEGVARFAGKPDIYEKYLRKLFAMGTMDTMFAQLESQNIEGAFRSAHDLKGNAGNLSVRSFYKKICELVEILRGGSATKEEYMPVALRARELYEQARSAVSEAEHD